jgi:hypothetical protein
MSRSSLCQRVSGPGSSLDARDIVSRNQEWIERWGFSTESREGRSIRDTETVTSSSGVIHMRTSRSFR